MTTLGVYLSSVDVLQDNLDHRQRVDTALDGLVLRPTHVVVDRAAVACIDGDICQNTALSVWS